MNTRTRLRTCELPREYAASLRAYLGRKDETALRQAYELGRQALAAGLGVLDMTRLHHEAFATVNLQLPAGATTDGAMHAATRFFVESLTPFEMTLHGYGDVAGALRASDERFRELFEHANDTIFVTDLSGRCLSMNGAGERVTGYTRDEIRSMNLATLVAPESQAVLDQLLRRHHTEQTRTRYELDIVTKDGRRAPLEISVRLITQDGQPIGIQGIARDITERRDAERALHAVNQRLEEEARRIAHALHDEAAQLLVSIYLALDALAVTLSPQVRFKIAEVRALLEQVEAQLRHFSHELRPTILDDFGLIPALQFLAEGVSKRTGLSVTVMGSTGGRLSTDIETVLYRIVQEGLTNVTRHAKASRAVIDVRRDADKVVCSIDDNGQGFETSTRRAARTSTQGLGLIGIKERVAALSGTLAIRSRPGAGTTLEIAVPLHSAPCRSESSSLTTT